MKRSMPLACALAALVAWFGLGCRAAPILVGSDLSNPPFAAVDERGRPVGRDVEMTEELARRMGRSVEWRILPFGELLGRLEAGELDWVVATLGYSEERAKRVRFSEPYFRTAIRAVVRTGAGEPRALADLRGRTVAAGTGTTAESARERVLPTSRRAPPSPKGESSLERLLGGEVDAVLMDEPNALAAAAAHPGVLGLLSEVLAEERYAVAVRPDRPEWVDLVNRHLVELEREGRLAQWDRAHGLTARAKAP